MLTAETDCKQINALNLFRKFKKSEKRAGDLKQINSKLCKKLNAVFTINVRAIKIATGFLEAV